MQILGTHNPLEAVTYARHRKMERQGAPPIT